MADPALGEIYTGAFEAKVQGGRVNAGHKDFTGPHDTSTRSGRASVIQDAIDYAEDNGDLPFVVAPDNLLNWDASAVNYSGTGGTWTGRMVREGQQADVYDVKAYGAAGDGATNDTSAIQAALDAGTGEPVAVPGSATYITDPLSFSGASTTLDVGRATLRLSGGQSGDTAVIEGNGHDGCIVRGGTLDGNKANQSNSVDGVRILSADNCAVYETRVKDPSRHGIFVRNSTDCLVYGNRVDSHGSGSLGGGIFFFIGCNRCIASENIVNCGGASNIGLFMDSGTSGTASPAPVTHSAFIGNVVIDGGQGIDLEGAHHCVVDSNVIENMSSAGVICETDQGGDTTQNTIISNNRIKDASVCIDVVSGEKLTIIGNHTSEAPNSNVGIRVSSSSGEVIESVAVLSNETDGHTTGIQVRSDSADVNNVLVADNHCINASLNYIRVQNPANAIGGVLIDGNYGADPAANGTSRGIRIENDNSSISDLRTGVNALFDAGTTFSGDIGIAEFPVFAGTGIGDGSSTNLTAPAQGTGSGPSGLSVDQWIQVNRNGGTVWIPTFT